MKHLALSLGLVAMVTTYQAAAKNFTFEQSLSSVSPVHVTIAKDLLDKESLSESDFDSVKDTTLFAFMLSYENVCSSCYRAAVDTLIFL